jgi:hypothetical protein
MSLSIEEVNRRVAERKAAKEAARVKANQEAALLNAAHHNAKLARQRGGARAILPIEDGCVFVVSDQHYYPGLPPSKAHKASLVLARKLKPYAIVANGDGIDGACISRWPSSSFTQLGEQPSVVAELDENIARLKEYESFKFVKYLTWNMGNHDARFETRLAEKVPQYAGVAGFTLKEHFPHWAPAWRTDFCARPDAEPEVITKHRFKSGLHAGINNVLWSGSTMVTGHDHMLKTYSVTIGRKLRWGIHAGTMAPTDCAHFTHYTEDNPVNWQEGFPILHFLGGKFRGAELVHVEPDTGEVVFRGKEVKLDR